MITPSALNVIIIGLSVIVFMAFWKAIMIWTHDTAVGRAMSVISD